MADTTHTFDVSQAIRKNTFVRTGYTFSGWNLRWIDENKWYYENSSGQGGWFEKDKQPAGYSLDVYPDECKIACTADGNDCEFYAVWK